MQLFMVIAFITAALAANETDVTGNYTGVSGNSTGVSGNFTGLSGNYTGIYDDEGEDEGEGGESEEPEPEGEVPIEECPCSPPEYACKSDFSGWLVCDIDGWYVDGGDCGPDAWCEYINDLPYCLS
ncbi:hypothetical protein F5B19DRAFT_488650 [Rostrohypoxylon terebratum]|nr:hypothetical protein F5B19DRAFT_488650 [Rostrohypoxylon terebratum]